MRAIEDQSRVLDDLRARAGTIFAAAALVTSFLGGLALDRDGSGTGFDLWSWTGGAVASFVVAALLTFVILWPFDFDFSLSASDIFGILDARENEEPVSALEAYRELGLRLELNYDRNATKIQRLFWCYRLAIVSLVVEVALWIVVLQQEM